MTDVTTAVAVTDYYGPNESKKARDYRKRLNALEEEAQPYFTPWQEAANHFMPGSVRIAMRGSAGRTLNPLPDPDIVNGAGVLARRIFESGMMASLTNPLRPWCAIGTIDPDVNRSQRAKLWYHQAVEWMFGVLAGSNAYQVLPKLYGTLGTHGTSGNIQEPDEKDTVRLYNWTTGSYFLASNPRQEVDTAYVKLQMTVLNLVKKFGEDKVSQRVRNMYANKNYDAYIDIIRVIEPNDNQQYGKEDHSGMPVRSCWFEEGTQSGDGFLKESGYWDDPLRCPRWDQEGSDTWGRGMGFQALADSRMLQSYGRREGQYIDYMTAEPVEGPSSLEGSYPLPGETVSVPFAGTSQNQVRPISSHPPAGVNVLDMRQQRLEARINEWWYVHLWMSILNDERKQRATAREVAEAHEEKLIQLGPALVRIFNELLDKMVLGVINEGIRQSIPFWRVGMPGVLPIPPQEVLGRPIKVEYISQLALAMKLVGIASIERLASFGGSIFAVYPDIIDTLDWDRMTERYADRLSTDPDFIIPEEVRDARRRARAAAKAQQQQATETMPAVAQSAQVLSQTDVQGDSALNRLLVARGLAPAFPGGGQ